MEFIISAIDTYPLLAWAVLIVAFTILAKCADIFVESAIALADRFNIPKLVIGIVLVSLATTAPEMSVSLLAALRGNPEMALGNAIGSVICDDGIALSLAGLFALSPIVIMPQILKSSIIFLVLAEVLIFLFVVFDGTLGRLEGAVLVVILISYITFLYRQHKQGKLQELSDSSEIEEGIKKERGRSLIALIGLFVIGLGGIIGSSHFIVTSATAIARSLGIPEAVIALTLVAFGTSIPEIATCIIAARKGEGALAVGNILGADILNICWVAGLSAVANPLTLTKKEIYFMFPAMFIIVGTMLIMLRTGYRLTRQKGVVLLLLYALYIGSFFMIFPPTAP